jgi:hypothetical protein
VVLLAAWLLARGNLAAQLALDDAAAMDAAARRLESAQARLDLQLARLAADEGSGE